MRTPLRKLLFFLILLAPAISSPAQDTVISGIRVRFDAGKKMFPARWKADGTDAVAVSLHPSQRERVSEILLRAMEKYPAGMPNTYLNRIYVTKSLSFFGYPYGGTYARKTLYLTLDEENPVHTDQYLEERFHHEFSSILWKENIRKLDLVAWGTFNPDGFTYGEGGMEAIRNGIASMEVDPGYFDIGFINRYAMTEIEQDINVLAQQLFSGGPGFWQIVDTCDRIRGKTRLLIGFYHALDPLFTEAWFRSLP